MTTPIETTAEALKDSMAESWRGVARDALVSLAQHRDDIAEVLHRSDQGINGYRPAWEQESEVQRESWRWMADAVLAYLAGETS